MKKRAKSRDEISLWKLISVALFVLLAASLITAGFREFLQPTGAAARIKAEAEPVEKPLVELFVMSKCPFGVNSEILISKVKDLLGNKFNLKIYYIARENTDGTFSSLHGQEEVDENMRQICIAKYYPSKLMQYLKCINKDYVHADKKWEICAEENYLDVDKVEECWKSTEGKNLLRQNIKISNERKITVSPTIFINGIYYQGYRTAEAIKNAICDEFTEKPDECETSLGEEKTPSGGSC